MECGCLFSLRKVATSVTTQTSRKQSSLKVKNKLKSSACLLDVKSIEWQNTNPTKSC